jgi:hypothetical protein
MQIFEVHEPPSPEAGGGAPASGNMIGGKSGGGDPPLSVATEASSPATASGVEVVASSTGTLLASSEAGGLPGCGGMFELSAPPVPAPGPDGGFSDQDDPVVLPEEAHPPQRATASGRTQLQRNLIRS